MEREKLAALIEEIGFSCTWCAACCKGTSGDDNLVMVYPGEIAGLSACTGSSPRDFSEPYPESVFTDDGGCITFEWCLKRTPEGCIFLDDVRCRVYGARPWICRTYPFMLRGDDLIIAPCSGLGRALTRKEAQELADLLIAREHEELAEEERVRTILSQTRVPHGKRVLVDGTGMRVL